MPGTTVKPLASFNHIRYRIYPPSDKTPTYAGGAFSPLQPKASIMVSLWTVLSGRWLRARWPEPSAASVPLLSITEIPSHLRRDLNLGEALPGEADFSLRPSIRGRMISPFAGF